jgi:dUTP pyrophosphatase
METQMNKVKLKVKKLHPDAILPSYGHVGDSGLDLYSVEDILIKAGERVLVHTGIAMEYPSGYCTLIWDKSGLAANSGIKTMGGVFEHVYKGEYKIIMFNTTKEDYQVKKGQKIAQVLIQPIITAEVEEVQELSESTRGASGFGSTGMFKK